MPHRHQPIRIATLATALGRAQAKEIILTLQGGFPLSPFEIVEIAPDGGLPTLMSAIGKMDADIGVVRAMDLPFALPEGLAIGSVTKRLSGADALIAKAASGSLADLPSGTRVGVESARVKALLGERRGDLTAEIHPGDTESLLAGVDRGDLPAAVCPMADLMRLGAESRATVVFDENEFIAAAGQGCLVALVRTGEFSDMAAHLMDADAKTELESERAFHEMIGVGPEAPVGVRGWVCGREMLLRGFIAQPDGKVIHRNGRVVPKVTARTTGRQLGQGLLAEGGQVALEAWRALGASG